MLTAKAGLSCCSYTPLSSGNARHEAVAVIHMMEHRSLTRGHARTHGATGSGAVMDSRSGTKLCRKRRRCAASTRRSACAVIVCENCDTLCSRLSPCAARWRHCQPLASMPTSSVSATCGPFLRDSCCFGCTKTASPPLVALPFLHSCSLQNLQQDQQCYGWHPLPTATAIGQHLPIAQHSRTLRALNRDVARARGWAAGSPAWCGAPRPGGAPWRRRSGSARLLSAPPCAPATRSSCHSSTAINWL